MVHLFHQELGEYFYAGQNGTNQNNIDFVTIASTGDATALWKYS